MNIAGCAQNQNVQWSAHRKLSWNDFSKVPDSAEVGYQQWFTAVTQTSYAHSATQKNNKIIVQLKTIFHKELSKVKSEIFARPDSVRQQLLAHEQLHFDLAEIYRRKMVQEIENAVLLNQYKKEIAKIVSKYQSEFNKEQLLYDRETMHGMDKTAQKEWASSIARQLQQSQNFSKTSIEKTIGK